ncbi:MAG: exosortase/archaeosortase family protein [Candidatus Aenigmatarchaeota archaeon]
MRKLSEIFLKLLPALSYIPPLLILYVLDPVSFDRTWKGRAYYMFFMWAVLIETIQHWDNIKTEFGRVNPRRTLVFLMALLLPILYVFVSNFISFDNHHNLNQFMMELSRKCGMTDEWFINNMPLAIEYLAFTVIFNIILLLGYGLNGVAKYSVSSFLLGLLGFSYLLDNLYPNGRFAPFQVIVPTTTTLAAQFLKFMGYQTSIIWGNYWIPTLIVWNDKGRAAFMVAWPCSGVDSLLLYSVVSIIFLKNIIASKKRIIAYFLVGAMITYLINILRITTIYIIAINHGDKSPEFYKFHEYYGPLYSIIWIIIYPLIIIAINFLWRKIKGKPTDIISLNKYLLG